MIHVEYRAECDGCGYQGSTENVTPYLTGGMDGPWYSSPVRTICRGCIIDRACRIFGHEIVRQPAVLGGRTACTRCQTFQDPVASLEITFGTRETGPIRGGFISPGWECR